MKRVLSLPYSFVVMNWAAVIGLFYFLSGKKDVWFTNKSAHSHKERRNGLT